MGDWREDLLRYLPSAVRRRIQELSALQACALLELRVRAEQRVEWVTDEESTLLEWRPSAAEVQSLLAALCEHSLYARQEELCQGFLTVRGGHRIGVCGRVAVQEGRITGLHSIGSLCVRIARPVPGAADALMPRLFDEEGHPKSTLVLSPPGCGKTTVLRDATRQLSDIHGQHVCVADERSELCGAVDGVPQMPVGSRTDVMDGCPKAQAMQMLLRAMSPQWIVTDEIGREEDAQAVLEALRCGVSVLASAHADSIEALRGRPVLRRLMEEGAFSGYVLLAGRGRIKACFDTAGQAVARAAEGLS